ARVGDESIRRTIETFGGQTASVWSSDDLGQGQVRRYGVATVTGTGPGPGRRRLQALAEIGGSYHRGFAVVWPGISPHLLMALRRMRGGPDGHMTVVVSGMLRPDGLVAGHDLSSDPPGEEYGIPPQWLAGEVARWKHLRLLPLGDVSPGFEQWARQVADLRPEGTTSYAHATHITVEPDGVPRTADGTAPEWRVASRPRVSPDVEIKEEPTSDAEIKEPASDVVMRDASDDLGDLYSSPPPRERPRPKARPGRGAPRRGAAGSSRQPAGAGLAESAGDAMDLDPPPGGRGATPQVVERNGRRLRLLDVERTHDSLYASMALLAPDLLRRHVFGGRSLTGREAAAALGAWAADRLAADVTVSESRWTAPDGTRQRGLPSRYAAVFDYGTAGPDGKIPDRRARQQEVIGQLRRPEPWSNATVRAALQVLATELGVRIRWVWPRWAEDFGPADAAGHLTVVREGEHLLGAQDDGAPAVDWEAVEPLPVATVDAVRDGVRAQLADLASQHADIEQALDEIAAPTPPTILAALRQERDRLNGLRDLAMRADYAHLPVPLRAEQRLWDLSRVTNGLRALAERQPHDPVESTVHIDVAAEAEGPGSPGSRPVPAGQGRHRPAPGSEPRARKTGSSRRRPAPGSEPRARKTGSSKRPRTERWQGSQAEASLPEGRESIARSGQESPGPDPRPASPRLAPPRPASPRRDADQPVRAAAGGAASGPVPVDGSVSFLQLGPEPGQGVVLMPDLRAHVRQALDQVGPDPSGAFDLVVHPRLVEGLLPGWDARGRQVWSTGGQLAALVRTLVTAGRDVRLVPLAVGAAVHPDFGRFAAELEQALGPAGGRVTY
ncbi:MAG TPA: hypothetical protein VF109_05680, partial [Mycobacteriales bacterium]